MTDWITTWARDTAINQLSPDLMMAWEWKSHLGTTWVLSFEYVCLRVCVATCLPLLYLHNFSYFVEHSLDDCLRTETDGRGRLVGCMLSTQEDFSEPQGICSTYIWATQWHLISIAAGRMFSQLLDMKTSQVWCLAYPQSQTSVQLKYLFLPYKKLNRIRFHIFSSKVMRGCVRACVYLCFMSISS